MTIGMTTVYGKKISSQYVLQVSAPGGWKDLETYDDAHNAEFGRKTWMEDTAKYPDGTAHRNFQIVKRTVVDEVLLPYFASAQAHI